MTLIDFCNEFVLFLETRTTVGWKQLVRTNLEYKRFYLRNDDPFFIVAFNFHDGENEHLGKVDVSGGDDALKAFWHDLDSELKLFASHATFLERVAAIHEAHW